MLHHISMRQKIIVMIAVMSGLFLVALDQTIIATALTRIVEDFNSYDSLGLIVTSYLLFSTITVPIAGKFSDMFGRRPVLLSGVAIFTLASLLSGLSANIEQLIAFRALQGLGGGIIMANAFTIIGDLFSPRERSRWQGIFGAVFGLASVAGPLLGGWLTDSHQLLGMTTDWRWTFWINVPIGIAVAVVIAMFCPAIRHDKKPKIDYAGSIALMIALASLVLAVDNPGIVFGFLVDAGWNLDIIKSLLVAISAIGVVAFIAIERRAKEPVLPLEFFKNRNFSLIMAIITLFGAAFLGAILYLTQFNQQVYGANATESGLMLLPMIAGMMSASIGFGQIVARTGRYKIFLSVGFAVATAGILALTTLTPDTPYWHEAIMMAVIGVGLGMGMPIMNLAVQNEFKQKDLGAATASTQLFRNLGSTIGTAVLSGVLTAGIASHFANIQQDPFVQQVTQSPVAAKMLEGGEVDANTALALNQARDDIKASAHADIENAQAPSNVPTEVVQAKKAEQIKAFDANQQAFSDKVVDSFTASLRTIFYISAGLMTIGLVGTFFVRERKLKGNEGDDGPGIA